jgi:hypothetical protein
MDRRPGQSQAEVLADANRLAGAGLRQAALDLLLEFLDEEPEAVRVLAAVGRLYLLEKNFPKSVLYLQKSLHIEKVARSRAAAIDAYDEDYDEQDLAFVTAQVSGSGQGESDDAVVEIPLAQVAAASSSIDSTSELDCQDPESHITEDVLPAPAAETVLDEDLQDQAAAIAGAWAETDSEVTTEDVFVLDEDFEAVQSSIDSVIAEKIIDIDQVPDDTEGSADEELLDDELYLDITVDAVPDEAYELSWEEIDDLENYTPAPQEQSESVIGKGKLTREQRARQVAVDVMHRFDLDRNFLPLLQVIFFENGWGAARVAIERELTRGTLREELALAREVRQFWWQSDRYWTTFRGLYSNAMSLQAEATYRMMSWAEALRLIACFPGLPGIEEIEDLIEECFLLWYESKRLRRSFPVFFKFLKYRTASMPGTLSRWEPRCFDQYQDDGVEDPLFKEKGAEEELRRQLWEFGIDVYKVRDYDNKFRANPEEIEE